MESMSIPHYNSNPEQPSDEARLAEYGEGAIQMQVLFGLDANYQKVVTADASAEQNIRSGEGGRANINQQRFTWPGFELGVTPAPLAYDEMIWLPQPGTQTANSVESISVRQYKLRGEEFSVFDPDEEIIPSDKAIGIKYIGSSQFDWYLVNHRSSEPTPFADGEALIFDNEDMFDPHRPAGQKPSVLTVQGNHWQVPYISYQMLRTMLLDDSKVTQREKPPHLNEQ